MNSKQRRTDKRLRDSFVQLFNFIDVSKIQDNDVNRLKKIVDKRFKLRKGKYKYRIG